MSADPARRLLLSAVPRHRRAAPGRDGEVAAPAGPRGHGADDLAPTARRRPTTRDERRRPRPPTCSAGARGSRGKRSVDALFDSDTYSGRPHPLSKVIVPEPLAAAWAPFARRGALRLHARAALRLRDHDLAAGVRPHDRARAAPPRRPLGRRHPRRLDLRAAAARRFRPRPSAASTSASSAAGSAPPTPSSASAEPAADDLRARGIADPLLIPNGWDPEPAPAAEADRRRGLLDPERDLARLHRPLRQLRPRPGAARRGRWRGSRAADPTRPAKLELVIAGPLTEDERALFARRRLAGADRPRSAACRASAPLALQREADALLLIAQPTRSQLAQLQAVRVPGGRHADPRARRRDRGGAGRRPSWAAEVVRGRRSGGDRRGAGPRCSRDELDAATPPTRSPPTPTRPRRSGWRGRCECH